MKLSENTLSLVVSIGFASSDDAFGNFTSLCEFTFLQVTFIGVKLPELSFCLKPWFDVFKVEGKCF